MNDNFFRVIEDVYNLKLSTSIDGKNNSDEIRNKLNSIYNRLDLYTPSKILEDDITLDLFIETKNLFKNLVLDKLLEDNPNTSKLSLLNLINSNTNLEGNTIDLIMLDLAEKMKIEKMRSETRKQAQMLFQKFDINGDGVISKSDLESRIKELGLPSVFSSEIMKSADILNDGKISMDEFYIYTEKRVVKHFKIFYNLDINQDDKLNYSQARAALSEVYPNLIISDSLFNKLFDKMDEDKSNEINLSEWCQFLLLFPENNIQHLTQLNNLIAVSSVTPGDSDFLLMNKDFIDDSNKPSFVEAFKSLLCGAFSGFVSRTLTTPLDNLRIIYQSNYKDKIPPNILVGLKEIYKTNGFKGLFKANSITLLHASLEQALRFGIIDYSKKHLQDKQGNISPVNLLKIGVFTGILSTLFLFPLEVVRIRIVSMTDNVKVSVPSKFKKIFSNQGIRGFYSGFIPHLFQVLPSGSLHVVLYNSLKKILASDDDYDKININKFAMMAGGAGILTGIITYPLNIITTRTIVENRNLPPTNRISSIAIINRIKLNEGYFGFYKGVKASVLRSSIGQAINFGLYEKTRAWIKKI